MTNPGRGRGQRPGAANRSQQGTFVLLRLAGAQATSLRAINPHTDDAQVALRIGTTLIYVDSLATAAELHKPFADMKPLSRRLPRNINGNGPDLDPQPYSPSIAFEFTGNPDATAHVMPGRAHDYFRVVLGQQLGLEMYDLNAFGTVLAGFTQMRDMSLRAFPEVTNGIQMPSGFDAAVFGIERTQEIA